MYTSYPQKNIVASNIQFAELHRTSMIIPPIMRAQIRKKNLKLIQTGCIINS